jgi:hypothetical protein
VGVQSAFGDFDWWADWWDGSMANVSIGAMSITLRIPSILAEFSTLSMLAGVRAKVVVTTIHWFSFVTARQRVASGSTGDSILSKSLECSILSPADLWRDRGFSDSSVNKSESTQTERMQFRVSY